MELDLTGISKTTGPAAAWWCSEPVGYVDPRRAQCKVARIASDQNPPLDFAVA